MNFPTSDNEIKVRIGVHREALFIDCDRKYFELKISAEILKDNFISVADRRDSDGGLILTHLNSQNSNYWEQLAQWLREQLNN